MQYRSVGTFGGRGTAPEQFSGSLAGITIGPGELIFAVGDSEVKVYDASGRLQRRWQTGSPGLSVAVSNGKVYVGQEKQLEIFDLEGNLLNRWQDPDRLGAVTAIQVVDSSILVADARDRSIRRFDEDGQFLNNIGKENRMKGFNIPNGTLDFSVDHNSVIHACNPGKHRVERYTLDGELLGHIGRFGGIDPRGFQGCCNPTNVAVSGQGDVYVTEKAGPRAKVLNSAGELLAVIATDEFDPNSMNMDLVVDSKGRVYV
ncbi:MAG: hypothetical protein JSU96_00820, partial [Acidobacteriota bacterium]